LNRCEEGVSLPEESVLSNPRPGRLLAVIVVLAVACVATYWQCNARSERRRQRVWAAIDDCERGRRADTIAGRRAALVAAEKELRELGESEHDRGHDRCWTLARELDDLETKHKCPEFLLAGVPCTCDEVRWPEDATIEDCPVPVCFPILPEGYVPRANEYLATLQCRKTKALSDRMGWDRSGKPMARRKNGAAADSDKPRKCKLATLCHGPGVGENCEQIEICDDE
jgi:hypothetical protein